MRYYQAWIEGVDDLDQESDLSGEEDENDWLGSSFSRSSLTKDPSLSLRKANKHTKSDDDIVFEYDDEDENNEFFEDEVTMDDKAMSNEYVKLTPDPLPRTEKKVSPELTISELALEWASS